MSTSLSQVSRKTRPVQLLCAMTALVSLLGASASMAAQPPNPKDLTQGVWELDLVKSKFCKPAPKKARREIVESGWGLVSVHWTGIDEKDKPIDTWYVWRYDGEKYPASIGKPANEAITWKLVNPSRVEFTHWSKDDKITEQLVRTISSDGQEMTQTRAYLTSSKECVDTQVFKRQ
ncbi:MAG TPA: hypothetical protein VGN07_16950 [Steroidobacteraceae bacterium]|jgi:hypothetical protein